MSAPLSRTLELLYGDLLDFPLLAPQTQARSGSSPAQELQAYSESIRYCDQCVLHVGRKQLVFGAGHPAARLILVGDFPSAQDNEKGIPFSDESGALLQKMVVAMKIRYEDVYLTNLFKCRPPAGQAVDSILFQTCEAHLNVQFQQIETPFVVALGDTAARALARSESPLPVLRRQEYSWNGRRIFCTHHPRDLLHSPAKKKEAWEDLKLVMRAMGIQ